jgi:acyl carrier protein
VGAETLSPDRAMLLGPCMVIGQEYPNVRVHQIDVSLDGNVELVVGELLDPDASLFVAHRGGQRWVRTYEPAAVAATTTSPFRKSGVYLITGGMGNIGVALAEYLAAAYGARLVLVGRSPMPRSAASERIERAGGELLYLSANVADESAMRGVVARAYERFGALHGVIHAAGVVGDYQEIKDSDPDRCDGHFQAKAEGVRVLERVLDGKPLDFCLLMSSLTSVLGGIGQAGYASANIYMDTFARRHNQTSTVPWLSVNWDVWRLADDAGIPAGLGGTLKELGMDAGEATAMVEISLANRTAGQLVVSTGDLDARIDQWIRLESLKGPRSDSAVAAPGDEIEQRVGRIWHDALGMAVGLHDNFADVGGHSLLAVKIVAELRKAFQIDLPVRALFDAPTVAELARRIHDGLVAEIEAFTDEEAQSLVVKE